MYPSEFIALLLWFLGPPVLVGIVLLKAISAKTVSLLDRRFWFAVLILVVAAFVIEFAFVVFAPQRHGLHLDARDIEIFGFHTMWAPFGFVAVVVVFPVAAWCLTRKSSRAE